MTRRKRYAVGSFGCVTLLGVHFRLVVSILCCRVPGVSWSFVCGLSRDLCSTRSCGVWTPDRVVVTVVIALYMGLGSVMSCV